MESLGNFPDNFLAEIAAQPAAILRAAHVTASAHDALREVTRAAAGHPTVVVTGMGASYFAGYPAVNRLAAIGVRALHVDSAELLHFRRAVLDGSSLLIMVSQSGESAEPVALARALRRERRRPFIVSVTNGTASQLAAAADVALDTAAGQETGPSTLTFAASLVVLRALADAIAAACPARAAGANGSRGKRGGAADASLDALLRDARQASAAAADLLGPEPAELAGRIITWVGAARTLVTLGRGPARAAAELGALILKEAAGVPAEALQSAQFRHGPLELAGGGLGAFVVATEEPTRALDVGLATELVERGASVVAIVGDGDEPALAHRLAVGRIDPALRPAVAAIPMELLAWRRSVDEGRDPGRLQVAAKVTTRE
jgi:glucosamine--fructose-6-phosphate aminotransferase (isomerizing)